METPVYKHYSSATNSIYMLNGAMFDLKIMLVMLSNKIASTKSAIKMNIYRQNLQHQIRMKFLNLKLFPMSECTRLRKEI